MPMIDIEPEWKHLWNLAKKGQIELGYFDDVIEMATVIRKAQKEQKKITISPDGSYKLH